MMTHTARPMPSLYRIFPVAAGALTVLAALLALAGWEEEVPILRTEWPGMAAIPTNVAVFWLLAGLALSLQDVRSQRPGWRRLGMACAFGAFAWGLLHLLALLLPGAWNFAGTVFGTLGRVTGLAFGDNQTGWSTVTFVLLGAGLLLMHANRAPRFAELLVATPLFISILTLASEAFRFAPGGGPPDHLSHLTTTVVFLMLELGTLFTRTDRGWMALMTGHTKGGALARRLLPVAMIVPLVLMWLVTLAQYFDLVNRGVGGALYSLALMFVQSALILWYASSVNRADAKRKDAEERLQQSERRYRALIENSHDAVALSDASGKVYYASPATRRVLGYAAEELQGTSIFDPIHAADVENVRALYDGMVRKPDAVVSSEHRVRAKDGSWRWLEVTFKNLLHDSSVQAIVQNFRDVTDRMGAHQTLLESEERFRDLVENASDVIYSHDVAGNLTSWNGAGEQILGYAPSEIVSKNISAIVEPEQLGLARQMTARKVNQGGRTVYELNIRAKDGRMVTMEISSRIAYKNGIPDQVQGVARDITERKRLEQLIRDKEAEFRRMADEAPAVLWVTNPDGSCSFLSRGWYEFTGQRATDGLGWGWIDAIHPDDRERNRRLFRTASKCHEPFALDYRLRDRNGNYRWVFDVGHPRYDADGTFVGYVGSVIDISRQKEAEQVVRSLLSISTRLNSTLDLNALLDILVTEAIAMVNAESGVAGLRTADGMECHKYFQHGKALPLEYNWPPGHGLPGWLLENKVPYLTNDALTDRQIVHELCVEFGVTSALSVPILDAKGEVLGFFEIHNRRGGDFTAEDQERLLAVSQAAAIAIQNALAYQRIQQTEESLKEADRRKDEFLATLAHELRNPLAPLRTGLELLNLAQTDSVVGIQARAMMERQVAQMVRLIDDLLDLSRITRGKLALRKEMLDFATIIQNAVETSRPLIESNGLELQVTLPQERITLDGDLTRLAQVFANLLNNSAKYTRQGGKVWLTAERQDGWVAISVRDTGVGIPGHLLTRVFDMFAQVDQSLERAQGGLGIGLTLVKRLVEMHGGSVEAQSEGPGTGSTFVVHLPIAPMPSPTATAPGDLNGETSPAATGQRILVADDNKDAADSLSTMLRLMGNETRTVHDGMGAVEEAEAFRPDVILLDIGMPKMNGYEAARQIRKQPWGADALVIAITGWGQEEDKRKAWEAGFDYHVTKPVDPAALFKLLTRSDATT